MTTEPGPADQMARSLELLWDTRDPRTARGPKPGHTLDQIVTAAIEVADTDGLDALSMRRVARKLGVGTMSLYRYVPGKAVLLDLMLDKVCDPVGQRERTAGRTWSEALEVIARGTRDSYLAHPWLLHVNWTRPVLGPNSLAGLELFVAVMDGLGLTDQERISALMLIDGFVTGAVRTEVLHSRAVLETGLSDDEFWTRQYPSLNQAMRSGAYPAMAALSADAFGGGWDDTFEWGLQRLLDGIGALIETRRGGTSR